MRSIIVLVGIVTCSGCASHFSEGMQSVSRLELKNGPTKGSYQLIDGSHRLISTANATSSGLAFDIPGKYQVDDCVAVVDAKRKPATDKPYIFVSVRSEYQKLLEQRRAASSQASEFRNRDQTLRQDFQATQARLADNRAYANQACVLLPMAQLPPPPQLKCESQSQCKQEATAVCYAGWAAATACGKVGGDAGISGAIAGPACGKAVAQLEGLGEQYGWNQAFVDSLIGAVDDKASKMLKSDSTADNLVGALVKLGILLKGQADVESCSVDFVKTQYDEPVERWESEVTRIRSEPGDLLNACQWDVSHLATLAPTIQDTDANVIDRDAHVRALEDTMRQVASMRVPIQWCAARQ